MRNKAICILYGNYFYDGRARRHVETLLEFYDVDVWHLNSDNNFEYKNEFSNTLNVINTNISTKKKLFSHTIFFYKILKSIIFQSPRIFVSLNYFTCYFSFLKKFKKNTIFIYDAYELLLTEKQSTLRDKFWFFIEKISINNFDLVIEANKQRMTLLSEYFNHKVKFKFISIRNIPKLGHKCMLSKKNKIRAELNIPVNSKIILYQGDVTNDRMIDKFLDAFLLLNNEFLFIIVGDGDALHQIKKKYNSLINQKKLICTGRIQNNFISKYTLLGDVGIITYPYKGLNNIYCSPNKIFEYSQNGVVILSTSQPSLLEMVLSNQIGLCINENATSLDIANVMSNLFCDIDKFKSNLLSFVNENSWDNEILVYKRFLINHLDKV